MRSEQRLDSDQGSLVAQVERFRRIQPAKERERVFRKRDCSVPKAIGQAVQCADTSYARQNEFLWKTLVFSTALD